MNSLVNKNKKKINKNHLITNPMLKVMINKTYKNHKL